MLPCATYYKRQGYPLKKIVEYAKNRDFTDLMVRAADARWGRLRQVLTGTAHPRPCAHACSRLTASVPQRLAPLLRVEPTLVCTHGPAGPTLGVHPWARWAPSPTTHAF